MRIETDSDYYYKVLSVYERLREEILKNYRSLSNASIKMNKSPAYLYQTTHIGSIKNLFNICKKLNLDFVYILLGKKKLLEKNDIDFSGLLNAYNKNKYKQKHNDSIRSIICLLRSGKKVNIKIATLFYFADIYRVNPLDLL